MNTYLPLGYTSVSTEVADKVGAERQVGDIERDGGVGVLVNDDHADLAVLAGRVEALGVGVGSGEVDLGGGVSEEGSRSSEEPVCETDGTKLVGSRPVGGRVDAVLAEQAENINSDQPASNVCVSSRTPLANRKLGPRVVDVDEGLESGDD